MQRGDVWMVSLPPAGSREQSGERPVIVMQDETHGAGSPLVLMVPLTSRLPALRFPGTLRIDPAPGSGLRVPSVAMVFQMRALDRIHFERRLGAVSDEIVSDLLAELDRLLGK